MVVLYCKCVGEGGGGQGVLPQKMLVLNGAKSCNFRQEKYEDALSWMLDSFHKDKGNIEKGWPFHNEYWTWKYVYM